jgi:hypothetical protein
MAYVQIANTDLQLRAGMFAQAQLEVSKRVGADDPRGCSAV